MPCWGLMHRDEALLQAALLRDAAASSDFDLNPGIARGRNLRPAAVLVAIGLWGTEAVVILTKRASHLQHHPGQIAFAGGKVEAGESVEEAALREAFEEIGLTTAEVSGRLPVHETVTGFAVTPILACVRQKFDPVPERGEVDEVFTVPLRYVMDPSKYVIEQRQWQGMPRRYYAVPYGPYYIWGATARILRGLAER
jgi:8-oxo-dGTP pyrophosphatase MutT (NUDIX family)